MTENPLRKPVSQSDKGKSHGRRASPQRGNTKPMLNISLDSIPGKMIADVKGLVQAISASVQQGDTTHLKDWLQSVIEEEEPVEDVKYAEELLKKLNDLAVRREKNPLTKVEELEESNYDQIDGMLNDMESKKMDRNGKGLSIMEKLEQNKERIARENSDEKTQKEVEKKAERGMD